MDPGAQSPIREISFETLAAFRKTKRRRKVEDMSAEEVILREAKEIQVVVTEERNRLRYFRLQTNAACTIQKAWKMYLLKTQGLLKNARDAVRLKRLDAGELEWKKQIAACTIQLAWRKYARRKILEKLKRNGSRTLHTWEPDMIALKQQHLLRQIYLEPAYAPSWHPSLLPINRPHWMDQMPSPAAASFNFAIDQYKQPYLYNAYQFDMNENGQLEPIKELEKKIKERSETRSTDNYPDAS